MQYTQLLNMILGWYMDDNWDHFRFKDSIGIEAVPTIVVLGYITE